MAQRLVIIALLCAYTFTAVAEFVHTTKHALHRKGNLELLPNTRDGSVKKSLAAIVSGARGIADVDNMVRHLGFTNFSFIFFHYDSNATSTWLSNPRSAAWYDKAIHVHVRRQMKWWYLKRFLTPEVTQQYEYLFLFDEDVGVNTNYFNALQYVEAMRYYNIAISEPALTPSSPKSHHITEQRLNPGIIGRWTDFVECGPLVVVSQWAWKACVWEFMQEDLTSGWGLDMKWYYYCKDRVGNFSAAILDKFAIEHISTKAAASLPPELFSPWGEWGTFDRRFPNVASSQKLEFGLIPEIPSANSSPS